MKTSLTVLKLQSGHKCVTEITIYNVERAIIPNVRKPDLCVLQVTCPLRALFFCKVL